MYKIKRGSVVLSYDTVADAIRDSENHMFLSKAQWYILAKDGYPFTYRGWTVQKVN